MLIDALATVFSPYGQLEKMAIFEKNGVWQVGKWAPLNLTCLTANLAWALTSRSAWQRQLRCPGQHCKQLWPSLTAQFPNHLAGQPHCDGVWDLSAHRCALKACCMPLPLG